MVFVEITEIIERRLDGRADEYRMALTELLRKAQLAGDVDFLQEGGRVLAQAVRELERRQQLGAER